jgi:hypothetical protein
MTILHDNLYTKRAVSALRGRNRYLSRAMWVKWVLPWPNRKPPLKRHGTMKNNLTLTTCWAAPSATSRRWKTPLLKRLSLHPHPTLRPNLLLARPRDLLLARLRDLLLARPRAHPPGPLLARPRDLLLARPRGPLPALRQNRLQHQPMSLWKRLLWKKQQRMQ